MFTANDDRHEFKPLLVEIEERPLNPLGRAVFWIVIAALLFTCLWMIFGEVDVVVTARGKVIPKRRDQKDPASEQRSGPQYPG